MSEPEFRSNLKYVGKATSSQALQLVLDGRGRFGRQVTSASADRALNTAKPEHIIAVEDALKKTKTALLEDNSQAAQNRLNYQRDILNILKDAGSRKLHATELTAILAFQHGFGQQLLDRLNVIRAMQRQGGANFLDGSVHDQIMAVRSGALQHANDYLLQHKNIVTSRDLLRSSFTGEDAKREQGTCTAALGILDLMGIARKLPTMPLSISSTYPYVHEEHVQHPAHKHLTLPTWNSEFKLLKALHENGELAQTTFGGVRDKPQISIGKRPAITIANLVNVGLVERLKKSNGHNLHLTPAAKTLLDNTINTNELDEELRRFLLGEAKTDEELTPRDKMRYPKLVTYLRILRKLLQRKETKSLYDGNVEIARELGLPRSTVQTVLGGSTPFGEHLTAKKVEVFLPHLRKEEDGKELEKILNAYLATKSISEALASLNKKKN